MAKTMERLMVSIPTDVKNEIDAVKQKDFYDKPYSELYRYIIRMGLTKMRETAGIEAGKGLQVPCNARQGNPQETKNYVLGVAEGMAIAKEKQQARQFQEA